MTEQKDLAQMCFNYRAANNLTQEEMGKRCGFCRMIISRVERGEKTSRMTEAKIRLVLEGEK